MSIRPALIDPPRAMAARTVARLQTRQVQSQASLIPRPEIRSAILVHQSARHAGPLTTVIYTHPSDEELRNGVRLLKCYSPGSSDPRRMSRSQSPPRDLNENLMTDVEVFKWAVRWARAEGFRPPGHWGDLNQLTGLPFDWREALTSPEYGRAMGKVFGSLQEQGDGPLLRWRQRLEEIRAVDNPFDVLRAYYSQELYDLLRSEGIDPLSDDSVDH